MKFLVLLLISSAAFCQSSFNNDLDTAYQNATKGIYWAYSNIPDSKNSVSNDLISNDQLIAEVRLSKEIKGIKVQSKGYFNTQTVEITAYKSYETLIKEGYIKNYPDDW